MTGFSSDTNTGLRFGVLGPLTATRSGEPLRLGGPQQRAVLARLLVDPNCMVSIARLADALWGERLPARWAATIQTYVSHLRDALEPERPRGAPPRVLLTDNGGYRLRIEDEAVDADRFERLLAAGRACLAVGRFAEARAELAEALSLWRGAVMADLLDYDFVRDSAGYLDGLHVDAIEAWVEAGLALGRHDQLAVELGRLVAAHPLRERLHGQRILALYRCGQQAEALAAYQLLRDTLADELGIEPTPELQTLYQSVLDQSPELVWRETSGSPASQPNADGVKATEGNPIGRPSRRAPRRWVVGVSALTAAATVVTGMILMAARRSPPLATLSNLPPNSAGSIDSSGRLRAAVAVGQSPEGLAYGAGALWVTNLSDQTVSRIDTSSPRVIQRITVGDSPNAVTVTGEDVWVANGGDGTVSRINAASETVVDIVPVGNLPSAIASGPSGVWVANSGDDTIQHIDPESGHAGTPIQVGGGPAGIAVGEHTIWVTNGQDGTVSRVDAASGRVDVGIPVGAGPKGIAATPDAIWVANSLDLTVSRIDPMTGAVVKVVPVGDGPHSIAVTRDTVWVSDEYDGTVARIDSRTNRATRRVIVGSSPRGLVLVGSRLWVASGSFASVTHKGGTLTVVGAPVPGFDTIDPAKSWLSATMQLAYDGLVAVHHAAGSPGLLLVPDLATTLPHPTDSGRTYTFTLRHGIRYSNGDEVNPEDIRRGVQRVLVLTHGYPAAYYYGILGGRECAMQPARCDLSKGVVTDATRSTVTFHLIDPDPDFLSKLANYVYATAPEVSADREALTPPPATGPYMISGFRTEDRRTQLTMVRNPNFRQWSFAAKPDGYPDAIRWQRVPSTPTVEVSALDTASQQVSRILAGDADITDPFLTQLPLELMTELAHRNPTLLHSDFSLSTFFEWLNTRVPPFNDKRVRQALNYAVDRRQLVALAGGPVKAAVSCQILPPGLPGYEQYCPYTLDPQPDGTYHGPDLTVALKLIAASGTRGMAVFVGSDGDNPMADYYVGLLRSLGYRATLRDENRVHPADSRTRSQIGTRWWGVDFVSPSNVWMPQLSCGSFLPNSESNPNLSEYCNRQVDDLARKALSAQNTDPTLARRLWIQVDHLITDDAPWVAGPVTRFSTLVSARVGNYLSNPVLGPLLDQLWVQ